MDTSNLEMLAKAQAQMAQNAQTTGGASNYVGGWCPNVPRKSCPNCGYCEHCGRSYRSYPYYSQPYCSSVVGFQGQAQQTRQELNQGSYSGSEVSK